MPDCANKYYNLPIRDILFGQMYSDLELNTVLGETNSKIFAA